MIVRRPEILIVLAMAAAAIGCDDRAARIAADAAQRQAEQNTEMARVNQGVLKAAEQLHQERADLNKGRDALEAERREIASSRRTESMLAALMQGGGATFVVIAALVLACLILVGGHRDPNASDALCELLVEELASDSPMLIRPPVSEAQPCLPHHAERPLALPPEEPA